MTNIFDIVVILSTICMLAACETVSYRGYKVYTVHPLTRAQLDILKRMNDGEGMDFWSTPRLGSNSSVMVSPNAADSFTMSLNLHNISHQLLNADAQQLIDQERVDQMKHFRKRQVAFHTVVRSSMLDHIWTLDEIYDYMDYLARAYPGIVRVKNYGTTYEGRPIKVITISATGEVRLFRPVVLVDGGVHAREWASHMSVLYLIYQLVERSAENSDMLANTDWVIMPVVNPDGYVYTHAQNRLWRKNRVPVNPICRGVDVNRNFPFQWSFSGGECSDGYAGPAPASEAETRALMLLMATYARATKVYLSVHSCGDLILYPYGYSYVQAPNAAELHALGERVALAVLANNGPHYRVGSASYLLYPSNGSDDFIYGSLGVQYAYTLELTCGIAGGGFIVSMPEMRKIANEAFIMFNVYGIFAGEQTVGPRHRA
ncbi:carboxypeptidase B-like [Toxorhynchites rutilus septentrionalis]|uniref:carboxypeptidase B-like n=1 Tax=Toxorhynchites rutilus septentrionalis TaxID=329112 RepID=UPI0024784FE2|nr:carboxypeptidase B-like [Toxorhynchites rutilus septentrionalis]